MPECSPAARVIHSRPTRRAGPLDFRSQRDSRYRFQKSTFSSPPRNTSLHRPMPPSVRHTASQKEACSDAAWDLQRRESLHFWRKLAPACERLTDFGAKVD